MTLQEIRARWPGYWHTGSGNCILVCSSARRITFCSEDVCRALQHANCGGRGCDYHMDPHHGYKITPESPAPKFGYSKKIRTDYYRERD